MLHIRSVVFAAGLMLAVALGLWLVAGLIGSTVGALNETFVLTTAVLIAAAAIFIGAYVWTPRSPGRSSLHSVISAVALALLYVWAFTSGDVGIVVIAVPLAAAAVAAIGGIVSGRVSNAA